MAKNTGSKAQFVPWLSELRYYGTLGGLALMVPLTLGMTLWLLPSAQAVDNWNVDGANGTLYVHGALTESACRLEMTSARQDIALGETGTGRLQAVGSQGEPVRFELRLADCLRNSAGSRDLRRGGTVSADGQPAVTVSFRAVRDADNSQLVKAEGVSGLGLRLEDARGDDVRLGSRGAPLLLMPGQDTLTYRVIPERTPANLMAGSYRAVVDFHLSYD
ncbi:PAP fimbrial minor pilin protein precursor [Serratia entomophila]|uniref:Type 1 fimbrial protein n=1 Tax=Serratia entomophila TaxID=42906 RepID=A0ABY5CW04_9GAMM|nr:fimbrial protein [Serratia entomophila]UIW18843.1 type 1 fimbrial protein [Serratia entomophila]USV01502.1 type 1 fimbrial protein [Serratia entomophila]CAI0775363.1 PAP fimbrial minor pilin protein precursor [Serratia entomophila]CAI0776281.1 PAP fimbrial minor pilin protein precursor [Serratia entomophila]CAI0798570.1 PAP fimbrial minor pilin protein precursor [Serratia entomophila]